MPTLVLMRHGEAGFAAGDRARPLTPRGREEAASQARAIARVVGGIDVAVVSDFSARALAHYMASGAMYRHRNRALALFGERRAALLAALDKSVPDVQIFGDPSGTELVLRLPEKVNELVVQMRLEDAGYQVSTLGDFAMRDHPPALLLQYGDLAPVQARDFAESLRAVLAS